MKNKQQDCYSYLMREGDKGIIENFDGGRQDKVKLAFHYDQYIL